MAGDIKMNYNPLITVTINLYNYERFIQDCIQSILNQTYKNFELIIVDDCSTDNSYEKAKKFEKKDNRVKVIRLDKNNGIGYAKNKGIIKSKGEYIVTLDADDMITKKSLEIRVKNILKHKVQFVYGDAILFKGLLPLKEAYKLKSLKISGKKWPRRLHCPNVYNIHAATVLISRDVYKKYGLYDEELGCKIDREMWLRLFGKKDIDKPKIDSIFINKCLGYYRWHSKQVSKKRQKDSFFNKINTELCEKKYLIRKKNINESNTRFLKN